MAIRIHKVILIFGVLLVFCGLLGAAGYAIWRLNQPDNVNPDEAEAGDICPDGQSCDCPDGYGQPSAGCVCWCLTQPNCPGGQSQGGTCTGTITPPGDGTCNPPSGKIGDDGGGGCCGSWSGTKSDGSTCQGSSGDCRSWETCDISNGACASGESCRQTSCSGDGASCGDNSACCSGVCTSGTCSGGGTCTVNGQSCSSNSACCSNCCGSGTTCSGSGTCVTQASTCDNPTSGWCGGDAVGGQCRCSNFDQSKCAVHAGSGCEWNGTSCVCGGGQGGGGHITGSVRHFCNDGTAACQVTVSNAGCFESKPDEATCNASPYAGCGTTTISLSPSQCYDLSPSSQDCGAWQLDATSLCDSWSQAESGCNWSSACNQVAANCGNGTCDSGETCETNGNKACPSGTPLPAGVTCRSSCNYCGDSAVNGGEQCDPPGNTTQCSGGAACSSSCTCPGATPQYLTVSGEVYCQDPNGERYVISGANIQFTKAATSESLTTDANGAFTSASNTTVDSQKPFGVTFNGFTDPSTTLPTGVAYSAMVGPVADNPAICTTGKCSTCSGSYGSCNGCTAGSNPGFNLKFTGCSTTPVNPDWNLQKSNTVACYQEQTINAYAEINYTISVTNVAGGGTLLSVTDELDSTISDTWVSDINPAGGVVSAGTVVWNAGYTFTAGETKTFTYKVRIPSNLFGQSIDNHVLAALDPTTSPDSETQLHAYSSALISCGAYKPPLPGTGLFDSTIARIVLGVICVLMGYAYYKFGLLDGLLNWLANKSGFVASKVKYTVGSEGRRDRWETSILKKAEKVRKGRRL